MKRRRLLAAAAAAAALAGCSLTPDYKRPASPLEAAYPEGSAAQGAALPAADAFFADPVVARLASEAVKTSREMRSALLAVERAQALYTTSRADLFPEIHAGADAPAAKLPDNNFDTHVSAYGLGLGFAAYELDLFGRVRAEAAAARESARAAALDAASTRITLQAEAAALYLRLVASREELDTAKASAENRRRGAELAANRRALGLASELEAAQAKALYYEAASRIASAAESEEKARNALELLIGAPLPQDLPKRRRLADVTPFAEVPAGLPSELLERRPDVLAAEHRLMAEGEKLGAARAARLPSISLTGGLGLASGSLGDLLESGSSAWIAAPIIDIPLFDAGKRAARQTAAEKELGMAQADWERTAQKAFSEVSDALAARHRASERLAAEEGRAASAASALSAAKSRHEAGLEGYMPVLDAERTLLSAQSAAIDARLARETGAVTLYKALGGGWEKRQ
jgi:outer membrane protein, multidrug efflux system